MIQLAKIIRSFIENEHQGKDPASIPSKRKAYESIYVFRLPLIVACIVPDGYRFLYVRKCGKGTPRKIAIRFNIYVSVVDRRFPDEKSFELLRVFLGSSVDHGMLQKQYRLLSDKIESVQHGRDDNLFQQKGKRGRNSFFFFFKIKWIELIFRISKWIICARCGGNTRAC